MSKGPRGKEAVRRALIEAAAELHAREAAPSVRSIAARAGVNHGLVHRHFGSKEGLYQAMMEALAEEIAADLPSEEEAKEMPFQRLLLAAFLATKKHERLLKVMLRASLDGEAPEGFVGTFPVVRRLIAVGEERGIPNARRLVAHLVAAGFGWLLAGDFIHAAAELEGDPLEELAEAVRSGAIEGSPVEALLAVLAAK